MWRFLNDAFSSQTAFQTIEQVQRGSTDTDRSLQDLTQVLDMGGQGAEHRPGDFVGHGQAREIASQLLEIRG